MSTSITPNGISKAGVFSNPFFIENSVLESFLSPLTNSSGSVITDSANNSIELYSQINHDLGFFTALEDLGVANLSELILSGQAAKIAEKFMVMNEIIEW